ncbi:BtpA/SgcQ family protein [Myxococcota bacterium]|nr:BtpA/SgcQ family protein [Myxococcota bacterium]MBU1534699.1 BtpA/SgcQ family protein [Myxococcota bacterium]
MPLSLGLNAWFVDVKPIIGMIHVDSLPGTPGNRLPMEKIIDKAVAEADLYSEMGIDGLMIENMYDLPYIKGRCSPEIIAAMAVVATNVKKAARLPTGIQILAGANLEAMAVAKAAGLEFVRVEGYVFGHIADEGYFDSCAGELLRYRKMIEAEGVMVFTDIKKKHSSHAITSDVDIVETAKAAEFFKSDGVILTGPATGQPANATEAHDVAKAIQIPVLIGSGVVEANLSDFWDSASGFIVGSTFKKDGFWANSLSRQRISDFMKQVTRLRNTN